MLAKAVGKQADPACSWTTACCARTSARTSAASLAKAAALTSISSAWTPAAASMTSWPGVTEPERKRKIIGEEFIRVFEEEAKKIGAVDFLAQGTIYPDVVESGLGGRVRHHQEPPQRRAACPTMSTSRRSSSRCATCSRTKSARPAASWACRSIWWPAQPFPGPGLAVPHHRRYHAGEGRPSCRTPDAIWREEVDKLPAVPAPEPVFCGADQHAERRRYGRRAHLRLRHSRWRAVTTSDFMTAEVTLLPTETITTAANRIVNEVNTSTASSLTTPPSPRPPSEFE